MRGLLSGDHSRNQLEVLQNWPEGLIALDKNLRVSVLSNAARDILGDDDAAYLGKHVHDALCVETRGFAHARENCPVCLKFRNPDQTQVHSTWWKNSQGENVSLDYHVMQAGSLGEIKYLISFVDTRKDTHNQEELEKYAEYLDKAPSPIAELDAEATIVFSNPAMNTKLLEHGFNASGHPGIFPDNIKDLCSRCLAESCNIECVEVSVEGFTYSWNIYPLNSSSNTVLAWMNDISEKRRAEETLKSQQSAARRDFLAKMVHELRTPINAIVGFSNILMLSNAEKYTPEERNMLERIYRGGLELADLISDTLDASKIEAGKMDVSVSQFNLDELIHQVSSQLAAIASDKSLKLKIQCRSNIKIRSDKNKVKQIINNLLSNALKYTEEGEVSLVVNEPQNRSIEIRISDTGIGMKPDELSRVFNEYQRVGEAKSREIQGTGLGLSLVKELVVLLKGEIDVQSTYGEGSTFTVYLPYSID